MRYITDWEQRKKRHMQFWRRENDTPLVNITAKKDALKVSSIPAPVAMRDRWLDTAYVLKTARERMENTHFAGDSIPLVFPNLGPDIFGATYGCDLVFEETTSYAVPRVTDWQTEKPLVFDKSDPWWQKVYAMTREFAADAQGDYFVGITDLHPGLDGLVSLRGPEGLCMDTYDCPEEIETRSFELLDGFKEQTALFYEETRKNLSGSTNWMGIWHEDLWYVVGCDFSCMLSREMYAEFAYKELCAEVDFLNGNAMYHLDGPGALKHLDAILGIPKLAGVQWVYGAGQPTAAHWIDVLKKIQSAGKCILIDIVPSDIDVLGAALNPQGVMFSIQGTYTPDEADNLVKRVNAAFKR